MNTVLKKNIVFSYSCHNLESNKISISHILPKENINKSSDLIQWVTQNLPFANWLYLQQNLLSINLLCFLSHEFDQQSFFLEMVRNQLFLKQLPFSSFQSIPFYLKDFEYKTLLLLSASFVIKKIDINQQFQQNLLLLTQTLSLGSRSSKMANCSIRTSILISSRRFSQTDKIFQIQKIFEYLLSHYAERVETDLFVELACFLSSCSSVFFEIRSPRHLSRLVFSQYIIRRNIKRNLLNQPEKRYLNFRFFHTQLFSSFEKKAVLGIMVVLSFLDKYESFDEEHILFIIQRWIPQARLVQGSSYLYQNLQDERVCTVYLEIYKQEEGCFNLAELLCLKKNLASELKECVQKLMPVLFTCRNEEQIMKNIITLNQEIHSNKSLPQLMIHFEKQTETDLIFIVIIVYVCSEQGIEASINQLTTEVEVMLERKEIVGYLEERQPKEALVYRFKLLKSKKFFRNDFSVNINLARKKVCELITHAIGEIRDYEGGLILKQQELFSKLQKNFSAQLETKKELLENFFYSISPIERQATVPIAILEKLFKMTLSSFGSEYTKKDAYYFSTEKDDSYLLIFIRAVGSSLKKRIEQQLKEFPKKMIISTSFSIHETIGIGLIIESSDIHIRDRIVSSLQTVLHLWKDENGKNRILRLNLDQQALTLDPRMLKDPVSKEVLQMLFEGLVRIGAEKKLEYAIAESIEILACQKTYIFHLRKCKWSNGSLVQANDFEYSWKTILSPEFITPYAHYLFPIKNAQAVKSHQAPISEVGVQALDTRTLRVDLEYPLPFFLELLTLPIFSPVNHLIDRIHPHWPSSEANTYLCNGPFCLKKNRPGESYILEKNPFYRDAHNVYLNQVVLSHTNGPTALKMFKNGELDWLGHPMRSWDPLFEIEEDENNERLLLLHRVYWCTFNTKTYPLTNKKLRQALSLALNRQELADSFPIATPAFSPLPPNHAYFFNEGIPEGEQTLALHLFEEALEELKLTRRTFPILHFLYWDTHKFQLLAESICNQWKKIFNIEIQMQSYNSSCFQKISQGSYEIATISWISWINNPLYTLYAFHSEDDYLNFPKWKNAEFQMALKKGVHHNNFDERSPYLAQAEAILIKESPVIPLVAEKNQAIKKKSLKVELNNESADFKKAIFSN